MYDMTKLIPRYFKIKLKNGKYLEVEPPRIKVLKKIMKLSGTNKKEMDQKQFDDIILATSMALSKNKQNYEVKPEWLEEHNHIDELMDLLTKYFEWVGKINSSKN